MTIRFPIAVFVVSLISVFFLLSCHSDRDQLEQKAKELHARILTLDSHVDTPLMLFDENFNPGIRNDPRKGGGKLDFPRMKEGGLDAAFFAVFIGQGPLTPEGYEVAKKRALQIFHNIHQAVEENQHLAGLALTSEDAYTLKSEGRRAVYIGVENGYPMGEDLDVLQEFYDLGARYLGLSHTRNNQICDASTDDELHGGLTDFGKEVIQEANRLGMIVDVSHISDAAFYDVLAVSQTPLIASHSNARAVCDHPRNLDDDMLLALAGNGGVLQLSILSAYVAEAEENTEREAAFADLRQRYNNFESLSDEEMSNVRREWRELSDRFPMETASVSELVDHVDYVVNLIGVDYVGIGTDFDGGGGLVDCFDVSELHQITVELLRRGYSEEAIEKIWSGNFMRVFRQVETFAGKGKETAL
jgi:membrane dipeptidase